MKNRKHLILLTLALVLISLGVLNTYNYWWRNNIDSSFLDRTISFSCYGLGSMFLASYLTYLFFIPKTIPFRFQMLASKQWYSTLETTQGKNKARKNLIVDGILFFLFIFLCLFGPPYAFKAYEKHQLLAFGKIQEVEISEIGTNEKGFPTAIIQYEFNGIIYTKELFLKNHQKGEKTFVRFSIKKPLMAVWNDNLYK